MQDIYLIVGVTALIVTSFVMMFQILRGAGRSQPSHHSQSDLTNMMILFQTMRDILTQQKDLAREFNISIDRKVNEVRRLIQSTGDVRAELERTKRELAALATRTRRDVSALERRIQGVDSVVVGEDEATEAEDAPTSGNAAAVHEPDVEEELEPLDEIVPPLEIIPEPEDTVDRDLFNRWQLTPPADLGTDDDDAEFENEYDAEDDLNGHDSPLSDEDVEDTRAAYRDLLSLQPASSRMRGPSTADVLDHGREGNGGQYLTPIQKRVYEYSDAGMRVPEIARELGVGKGEVRLILSLRHDRDR